ncbi:MULTISPECIES: hypothetical protein [Bacillaceae]|uniref:hypothetical protein n=1 Tax=Bacillaceae TaxID=186817 RepID=UPI000B237E76|nr:hypothetical protein [Bacillus sp. FJAT-27916]
MKKNTYLLITDEIMNTGQVSPKLVQTLSAPIVVKMFYNLFGPSGTHLLSENTYLALKNELEKTDHPLPEMAVPYSSSTLVHLYYNVIGRHLSSDSSLISDDSHDQNTLMLTVDDLLDLLLFAKEEGDEEYMNDIKNRLSALCKPIG